MSYLKEIVFAAIVCGVLTALSPGEKNGRYVRWAASLAFLCVLVTPIADAAQSIPEFMEKLTNIGQTNTSDAEYGLSGSLEVISSEICKAAARSAADHFGVSEDDFAIKLILDESGSGELSVREVKIYPKNGAASLPADLVDAYFDEIFGCDAEVIKSE